MKLFAALLVIAALQSEVLGMPRHLSIFGKINQEDVRNPSKIIGRETIYEVPNNDFDAKLIEFPPV